MRVFCWQCGHIMNRPVSGALLARCSQCDSADTHVTLSLRLTTFTRADMTEAAKRGKSSTDPGRRGPGAADGPGRANPPLPGPSIS